MPRASPPLSRITWLTYHCSGIHIRIHIYVIVHLPFLVSQRACPLPTCPTLPTLEDRFNPRSTVLLPTHTTAMELEMCSIMATTLSVHRQRTRPSQRPQMVLLRRPSFLHHSRTPLLTLMLVVFPKHLRMVQFTKAGPALQEQFSIHSNHISHPHQRIYPLSITIIDRIASTTLLLAR